MLKNLEISQFKTYDSFRKLTTNAIVLDPGIATGFKYRRWYAEKST